MELENSKKNISFFDYVIANVWMSISNFLLPLYNFLEYRTAFRNYREVIKKKKVNSYPISAVLRNGKNIILKNIFQVHAVKWAAKNECFFENDSIVIKIKNLPEIRLIHWEKNVDLGVLFEEEYRTLPVKGKYVIDVGANIGDSSIYFAVKGAKKVIAMEPSAINYNFAQKNIQMNSVSEKIELLMAGCSNKTGKAYIENDEGGSTFSFDSDNEKGTKIPLLTLEDVLSKINSKSTILKIDCEGCEYDIILSTKKNILQNFSHIQIEYHYGYKNIKDKLESCGFRVSIQRPRISKKLTRNNSKSYVGFLFAKKE